MIMPTLAWRDTHQLSLPLTAVFIDKFSPIYQSLVLILSYCLSSWFLKLQGRKWCHQNKNTQEKSLSFSSLLLYLSSLHLTPLWPWTLIFLIRFFSVESQYHPRYIHFFLAVHKSFISLPVQTRVRMLSYATHHKYIFLILFELSGLQSKHSNILKPFLLVTAYGSFVGCFRL